MATLGREPLRVDLMSSISGVSFSDAWRGRVRVALGRNEVGFLGLRHFIANKKASGRTKDLLDLALLAEIDEDDSRGEPKRTTGQARRERAPATSTPLKRR